MNPTTISRQHTHTTVVYVTRNSSQHVYFSSYTKTQKKNHSS